MNIGRLTIEMAANVARLQKDMEAGRRVVEKATSDMAKAATTAKNALAGIAAGLSVQAFASKLLAVQRQFDILNSSLITVTGSSAKAQQEFKWIKDFAATTPFALNEVTGAFIKMKALGLDASRKALESYGNTASAMGKDLNQFIEAVADAATGEFERLKEFGIKASKQGDEVRLTFQGVTTTVRNNATEITSYLQKLGETQFAGAMAERAKTLDGAISNLGDTWDELFRTVNEQGAGTLMHDTVRMASQAITDAITVLKALTGTARDGSKDLGAFKAVSEGIAIALETVAVLGVNVKYVLVQIGKELGGLAAQAVAFATGDFARAAEIGRMMKVDAAAARREVDAQTNAILNARRLRDIAATGEGQDEPRFRRMLEGQTTATNAATAAVTATKVAKESEYDKEMRKLAEDATKYKIKKHEEQLDAQEKAELEHAEWLQKLADDQNAYAVKKHNERLEAEEKAVRDAEEAREKAIKDAAEKQQRANEKMADELSSALTDALMRGFEKGEGFAQNLGQSVVNIFKTWVAKMIAEAIKNAILQAIASTQWGGILGGLLGGGGGGGNTLTGQLADKAVSNVAGSAVNSAIGNTIGAGNTGALVGGATGAMSWGNVAGSLAANAATSGMATGSIAASGAGIDALLATNAAYGTAASAGAAAGTAGAGAASAGAAGATSALAAIPVWGWVAIAAIALWQPLFGRKLKEAGTKVNLDGGNVTTQDYKFYKGGLFRSNKTKLGADTTAANPELVQMVKNVQANASAMAKALGQSDEAIKNFTGSVNINFKGAKTAEEQMQRVVQAMDDLKWQMYQTIPGLQMSKEAFKGLMEQVRTSIEQAGMGTAALTDIIIQGMTGRMNEAQVGEALANTVLGGIYNTIASPFAAQISTAFSAQIIEPVMTAVLAGVPVTGVVTREAIDGVIQTANNAANALNAIFADEGFRVAMAGVQAAIRGVSAAVVRPARSLPKFNTAVRQTGAAADDAARKAQELKDAWGQVSDSLLEEIKRIKGEVLGAGQQGMEYYQSQLAIKTAQARAGDINAARELPEISRNLLELAKNNAASAFELRAIEQSTLVQLETLRQFIGGRYGIALPGFAVGTNYVNEDMAAILHKGEAVLPKQYNPENGTSMTVSDVAAVFNRMEVRLAGLQSGMESLVAHVWGVRKNVDRVIQDDYVRVREEA